ncbi:hypothetical protein JZ751_018595 [Albula glossodonta]|uniref:Uncharacterized protein n=1 Tax=Albula glossodonta TaxID=121402 RepID=A0A8T2NRZ1_9TELE|nr:hypothetical protein JZ751_018595 [Albula glossodonta]
MFGKVQKPKNVMAAVPFSSSISSISASYNLPINHVCKQSTPPCSGSPLSMSGSGGLLLSCWSW